MVVPGLKEELSEKTGLQCEVMDPWKGITCGEDFDKEYLSQIGPSMSVAVGLGIRQPGDRILPDED